MTGRPIPVAATASPKIALTSVDLPTPVLPNTARLNRPIETSASANADSNASCDQAGTWPGAVACGGGAPPGCSAILSPP